MRVTSENYKGIEYIRISSLPVDQKKYLYNSLNHKLIINILKDNSLMNDCLQYQHYVTWYENIYKVMVQERSVEAPANSSALTLAFK
jgi:hypothetical protein